MRILATKGYRRKSNGHVDPHAQISSRTPYRRRCVAPKPKGVTKLVSFRDGIDSGASTCGVVFSISPMTRIRNLTRFLGKRTFELRILGVIRDSDWAGDWRVGANSNDEEWIEAPRWELINRNQLDKAEGGREHGPVLSLKAGGGPRKSAQISKRNVGEHDILGAAVCEWGVVGVEKPMIFWAT